MDAITTKQLAKARTNVAKNRCLTPREKARLLRQLGRAERYLMLADAKAAKFAVLAGRFGL